MTTKGAAATSSQAPELLLSLKLTKRQAIHANYVYSCPDSISYISCPFTQADTGKCATACDR